MVDSVINISRRIKSLVQYLLSKWMLLLLLGLCGGILGVTYAWLTKARYSSYASFALEEKSGALSGAFSLAAELGFALGSGTSGIFSGDNIIGIISSRRVVESVLLSVDTVGSERMTLVRQWFEMGAPKKKDKKRKYDYAKLFAPDLSRDKFSYIQDSLLFVAYKDIAKNALKVYRPDKKNTIYAIEFESSDERFTQKFTSRLIDFTTSFYTQLKTKRSRETIDILERRVGELKANLSGAFSAQAVNQDANANAAFAAARVPSQRRQIDIVAYSRAYEELFKNLELAKYEYQKDVPLIQVIDEPRFPMKKIKPGRLKSGLVASILVSLLACLALATVWFFRSSQIPDE